MSAVSLSNAIGCIHPFRHLTIHRLNRFRRGFEQIVESIIKRILNVFRNIIQSRVSRDFVAIDMRRIRAVTIALPG